MKHGLSTVRKPADAVWEALQRLDLEPVKVKLLLSEGHEWTLEQVEDMVAAYRRFLFLCHKYPEKRIVPTHVIDNVWHTHILDTSRYAVDCEQVFGYFLHHFPYLGTRGSADEQALLDAFAETKMLYEGEFGEPIAVGSAADCHDGGCSGPQCSASCTGVDRETAIAESRPSL